VWKNSTRGCGEFPVGYWKNSSRGVGNIYLTIRIDSRFRGNDRESTEIDEELRKNNFILKKRIFEGFAEYSSII
jgi:hypothetical protein